MISEKLIFWNSEDLITLDGPQNFSFSGFQKIRQSLLSHKMNENTVEMIRVRHDTMKN